MRFCASSTLSTTHFKHRHIRDPVHGLIGISREESDIINTPAFLRLQRIKQLSHTHIVYPSAVHTRFEHSVGAMHVASRMCDALNVIGDNKRLVRLAALLHDIGHGPFSHLFEKVLENKNPDKDNIHEQISGMIITRDEDIDSVLGTSDPKLINNIIQGVTTNGDGDELPLMSSIVSGTLDADKLDYLRRDSHHIGAKYGEFDLERILNTLQRTAGVPPTVSISRKGITALENYRLSRYMMHAQVYEHHARLAAELMFLNAMNYAIDQENVFDAICFDLSHKDFLSTYRELDDSFIYHKILSGKDNSISKDILSKVQNRKLLKRASHFAMSDINKASAYKILNRNNSKLKKLSEDMAQDLGLPSVPYGLILHRSQIRISLFKEEDLFYTHKGADSPINELSPVSSNAAVSWFYVFGPPDPVTRRRINDKMAQVLQVDPAKISANIR